MQKILEWLGLGQAANENTSQTQPDWHALKQKAEQLCKPYARPVWKPMVEQRVGAVTASKLGGVAALKEGEAWPCCGSCGRPMQLFVQLNSDELPEEAKHMFGQGLLQLFYCVGVDLGCETWEAFSDAHLARFVPFDQLAKQQKPQDQSVSQFPEKLITGWTKAQDYPSLQDLERLSPTPETKALFAQLTKQPLDVSATSDGMRDLVEALPDEMIDAICDLDKTADGEKLGGWPLWIQVPEYINCPTCGTEMTYLFQLDSEDNIPWMFGDCGTGHLSQCPNHPEIISFQWACT